MFWTEASLFRYQRNRLAVRNMGNGPDRAPDWKDQQEFFSQAASHFMIIKDAWRNYTAHARGKYTDDEAETILINVRSFMPKLSGKLYEEQPAV
jgi:hypothetical protein